jgi:predicted amino acid dehydrogenase
MGTLAPDRREEILRHFSPRTCPVVVSSVDVRSATGELARLYTLLLPLTSQQIKEWMEADRWDIPRTWVDQGIRVARSLGCGVVSLGQYTSIVTANGTSLSTHNMGITTGNSYALALALQAIRRAESERGIDPSSSVLAVVGATGNIGRTCAELLAPAYRKVLLVGSQKSNSLARLSDMAGMLPGAEVTTDPFALRAAHVIVTASNAVDRPLGPEHLSQGSVVCDLSVPSTFRPETLAARPDLLMFKGGIVQLPGGEDLEIRGFPLPQGQTYGCMAEGILLGFERIANKKFTGGLTAEKVREVERMARRHGFTLADYKKQCVLNSTARKDEVHAVTR